MEEIEEIPWYKGPIRIIIGLFLILILIIWIFPSYGIENTEPKKIPSLDEAFLYKDMPFPQPTNVTSVRDMHLLMDAGNPAIKNTANIIADSCENQVCRAKAMYYFVRDNFNYVPDPSEEYIERTENFFISGGGDCESGSLALANLLAAVGVEPQLVIIPGHAFLRIQLTDYKSVNKRDGWIYLDWTCRSCSFGELPYSNIDKKENYIDLG